MMQQLRAGVWMVLFVSVISPWGQYDRRAGIIRAEERGYETEQNCVVANQLQKDSSRDITHETRVAKFSKETHVTQGQAKLFITQWDHATDNWWGLRPKLEKNGIIIDAGIIADYSRIFSGGAAENADAFRHIFNFDITLDSAKMFGWNGGILFMDFMNINGQDGSEKAGDFQAFSNIDSPGRTEIYEFWYEQKLLNDKVRLKIGKVDANTEFAYVENGGEFINSSMGFSPTIFVLPTYPDPAISGNLFLYPSDRFYLGIGLYDGALQEGLPTGSRGPQTFFHHPADMFYIAEAGMTYELGFNQLPGRFALGGWGHTGTFECFNEATRKGTGGLYLLSDQAIWKENPAKKDDEQGAGLFFQFGWADKRVSEVEYHFGCGVAWTGVLPARDDDVCGLGVSWVCFSTEPGAEFAHDSETAVELFYKIRVTNWGSIKPDLQYIVNPGGCGCDNCLVGTLRMEISL